MQTNYELLVEIGIGLGALQPVFGPAWEDTECDAKCDITEVPCPTANLVQFSYEGGEGPWAIHPSLADFLAAKAESHEFTEDGSKLWTSDYPAEDTPELKVPDVIVKYVAKKSGTTDFLWNVGDILEYTRPQLMSIGKEIGLSAAAKKMGIDVRKQPKTWLQVAVVAHTNGTALPVDAGSSGGPAAPTANKPKKAPPKPKPGGKKRMTIKKK